MFKPTNNTKEYVKFKLNLNNSEYFNIYYNINKKINVLF